MITVKEYRDGQTKEAKAEFAQLEPKIDSALTRQGHWSCNTDSLKNKSLVNLITQIYRGGGWVVGTSSGSDPRDGDSWTTLTISAPRGSSNSD